jgi:hypothetical protein
VCARQSISVAVRIAQLDRAASGSSPSRACTGRQLRWQTALRTTRGEQLGIGAATGYVTATIKRGQRTVAVVRSSAPLALRTSSAPTGRPTVGDRDIVTGATFDLGPGVHVEIVGGGGYPGSNCTRNETNTSFTTTDTSKRILFGMVTKSGGSCFKEVSFSNFSVKLSGPGIQGSGKMWIGEFSLSLPYHPSCYSGSDRDVFNHNWDWTGLKCERTSDWELKISRL